MILYRQSLFARKDYEGLSEEGKKKLLERRKQISKKLLRGRKLVKDAIKGVSRLEEAVDSPVKMSDKNKLDSLRNGYNIYLREAREGAEKARKRIIGEGGGVTEKAIKEEAPGFFKKNKKALMIGGGAVALGGASLYGYKRYKDSKYNYDQREFGVSSKLKKEISDSLRKSASEDLNIMRGNIGIMNLYTFENPKAERELLKKIKNSGGRTLTSPNSSDFIRKGGGSSILSEEYKRDPHAFESANSLFYGTNLTGKGERLINKIKNAENSTKFQIYHARSGNPTSLSHEFNHAKNGLSRNPVKRFINKVANSEETRKRLESDLGENVSGFRNAAKDYVLGKIVRAEERNATRGAIKDLKKSPNISKEELEKSKESLKAAGNTYKYAYRARLKNILANTLDK